MSHLFSRSVGVSAVAAVALHATALAASAASARDIDRKVEAAIQRFYTEVDG